MRIGIIGTGAIAAKHAEVWGRLGCAVAACSNASEAKGRAFAERWGAKWATSAEAVCRDPAVELVDLCTLPGYRLEPVKLCAALRKPIQIQKPIATTLDVARQIVNLGRVSRIPIGVVSQHRFDESSQFLHRAIRAGRLGRILEADAYVKWYRPPSYYSRPVKGSWAGEGGGALINQAIHQVDLLRWIAGSVRSVAADWRLGAVHRIEAEDCVNALLRFESGALGVIQASTAFSPGFPERLEFHGTKGSAVITGDRLTEWNVQDDDEGESPPLPREGLSGSSDPMAISLEPFERQFTDLLDSCREGRAPLVTAEDGLNALLIVDAIYRSCRDDKRVDVAAEASEG